MRELGLDGAKAVDSPRHVGPGSNERSWDLREATLIGPHPGVALKCSKFTKKDQNFEFRCGFKGKL